MNKNSDNKNLGFAVFLVAIGMICLTFASVPLYQVFCRVTGYGGATKYSAIHSKILGTKKIKVKFDANIANDLNWDFKTEQSEINVTTGENALVFYSATNKSDKNIIGTAIYNVSPHKAAQYFNKIQCFCFEEQLLKAGQKMPMPVSFYIDPEIENDKNLADLTEITLSYSFFKVR